MYFGLRANGGGEKDPDCLFAWFLISAYIASALACDTQVEVTVVNTVKGRPRKRKTHKIERAWVRIPALQRIVDKH